MKLKSLFSVILLSVLSVLIPSNVSAQESDFIFVSTRGCVAHGETVGDKTVLNVTDKAVTVMQVFVYEGLGYYFPRRSVRPNSGDYLANNGSQIFTGCTTREVRKYLEDNLGMTDWINAYSNYNK